MPQPDRRACPALPPLEPRLQKRYQKLVQEHMQISQSVAAGLNALPGTATSFASTQAAWRFYRNANVSLPALVQPLIAQGRAALQATGAEYALVMHDWSHLNYDRHSRKADRCGLAREHRQGYELQSALLVGDRDGAPLAPLYQNLQSAAGLHTTRGRDVLPATTHLDELRGRWAHLNQLELDRPLVHIVDREGDSIGHYRQWQEHHFLVRAKGGQRVAWDGQSVLLSGVASALKKQLVCCREVAWHGRAARQYVGETRVVLTRPTRQKRRGQKPRAVAGEPVTLRLIVSEVRGENGRVLAQWLLLSNVSAAVDAGRLALWYYWRWRIESFFKLLKGAGQQVEHWQQANAAAVARRLLVVSAALVLVWQLERAESPAAAELRTVLVRLSGRQIQRGRGWTTPALLEGVWVLLAMLEMLEHYDLAHLRKLAETLFNPDDRN
ncbi:MAG: transposase [Immundisolibacter sp.]|uniref:transposase n=1 Tax=Immundisolibacter sp. TaxID=1934948 RepID=UPI003EE15B1A